MIDVKCRRCHRMIIIWDLDEDNQCMDRSSCDLARGPRSLVVLDELAERRNRSLPVDNGPFGVMGGNAISELTDAANNFGFTKPEDGSQERYIERRKKRPWVAHTFWWVVHNAVAHVLIGFLPLKPFFTFHDYTSRRLHGIK